MAVDDSDPILPRHLHDHLPRTVLVHNLAFPSKSTLPNDSIVSY